MAITITFERIGRSHDVPSLEVESNDLDAAAEAVFRHARRYLASSWFSVILTADGRGAIEAGRFGSFTWERSDNAA